MYHQQSFLNLIAIETSNLVSATTNEIIELISYLEEAMLTNDYFSTFSNIRALRIACIQVVSDREATPKKSVGHIEFIGDFEFFLFNENLYRTRITNAFDIEGKRLGARWEAPSHMVEASLESHRCFAWQPQLI